jgi:ribosomal protein S18 acetylase RimI-like enzyme
MTALIETFNRNRHNAGEVKALLALAVGRPTLDKLAYIIDQFYAPDSRKVFVALSGDKIVGIIGIEYNGGSYAFITHLAVRPDLRKKGIARRLIEHVTTALNLSDIEVETDHEAVDFYEACGFQTREIDSPYARYRRFRCKKVLLWR